MYMTYTKASSSADRAVDDREMHRNLIIVLKPEVSDQIFTAQVPQSVLQFHELNKDVVLRIQAGRGLWRFEIERQPLLHSLHTGPLGEIQKQRKVETKRSGEDRIATKEIDLDLHFVSQPAKDVDIIPALFVVAAGRIVVDPDDM